MYKKLVQLSLVLYTSVFAASLWYTIILCKTTNSDYKIYFYDNSIKIKESFHDSDLLLKAFICKA